MKRLARLLCLLLLAVFTFSATASAERGTDIWGFLSSSLTPAHRISLIHATVDGARMLEPESEGRFTARAMLDESSVVDHWEINGETVEGETAEALSFESEGVFTVEAVLRGKKTLNCVNCYFQFLNGNAEAEGSRYSTVVFEDAYLVPTTGEAHPGGTLSGQITAFVPSGKAIDYWIINGAVCLLDPQPQSFSVIGIDRDTHYEAVLRDKTAQPSDRSELLAHADPTSPGPEDGLDVPPFLIFEPDEQSDAGGSPGADDHEHEWILEYQIPGTCYAAGVRHFSCKLCGTSWEDYPMGEHSWVWEHDTWGHWMHCTGCGTYTAYSSHSMIPYTDGGYHETCSVCGFTAYG